MKNRIKKIRKELDLTQQEFADKIGIKRNTLSTYESGRNEPIDAVISLICREFNVSKEWLRTGEGDMFVQQSIDDKIDNNNNFINILTSLSADDWKLLIHTATRLADKNKEGGEKTN